jgi:alpha-N-arabinofuranosidase
MYAPFQGATALPVQVQTPKLASGRGQVPAVDMTAARGADGDTYFGLVNVAPDEAAQVQLDLAGSGRVSGQVLTATAMDSRNRFGAPEEVHPRPFSAVHRTAGGLQIVMPAKSIVVLKIDSAK